MSDTRHGDFGFVGGHPALDFVNTASRRVGGALVERIGSYSDLLDWSLRAGTVGAARVGELAVMAAAQPRAAAAAVRRSRELREAAFRLFVSLIEKEEPAAADLALLNRWTRQSLRRGSVRWDGERYTIPLPPTANPLDEPLIVVTPGIVDLLCGQQSGSVSLCADPDCSWLFLDRSPAQARRWCSMADCGNRAKARRHYERRKSRRS
jgi:predicted RNA-binding Zn ribbon-like protein